MDVSDLISAHYGSQDFTEVILAALRGQGVDVDNLTLADLEGLDHLHAGSVRATRQLLDALHLAPESRLLDVGSGIGGPARLAASHGAQVTGVDLTPAFVRTASEITARVDLADRARFEEVAADAPLPFPDASFDAAMMIHVGMNVPDKKQLFRKVRRVLVHGGRFAVYDQMKLGVGALTWPQPWADDEHTSFVESADAYAHHLTATGFTVDTVEDLTEAVSGPPPPGLTSAVVMGEDFPRRIANTMAATSAGLLAPVLVLARAT